MGKRSLKSNPSVRELKRRAENLPPSEDARITGLSIRMLLGRRIVRWKDRYRHLAVEGEDGVEEESEHERPPWN
jgi:hypothetical protein